MVKLLEFLNRHTARHLFRSSHLKQLPLSFTQIVAIYVFLYLAKIYGTVPLNKDFKNYSTK